MSASLVGSEMCIRDRQLVRAEGSGPLCLHACISPPPSWRSCALRFPVSYTHLTLPTICSV
eukprot:2415197-Alexandrium_andersonii.AAC.1